MKTFFFFTIIFSMWNFLYAEDVVEFDYELDAYYSNVSAFFDLDGENNFTDGSALSEENIYKRLLYNSTLPNVFLVEAAVHPMPLFGLYFRKQNEDLYTKAKIGDFNLVKSITAGFEEPYSLSFFLGRMMVFKDEHEDRIAQNRAYVGCLVTIGDYTIKDNYAYYDKWINIELKLKGTNNTKKRDLDWSFRLGTRIHEKKDFTDSIFLGARRSSIDYDKGVWSLYYNTAFTTLVAVNMDNFKLTEAEFMAEKKWPLQWSEKMSFGLGLGYLYYSGAKYSGQLKEDGIDNHQLIFRPNLKW